jgi:predicted GIY-YIG superfamily endonuclease
MWFAYALRSEKDGHLYIGMTADLDRRLTEHNRSYNQSKKSRGPFRIILGSDAKLAVTQENEKNI